MFHSVSSELRESIVVVVQPWAWALSHGVRKSHLFGHRAKNLGRAIVYASKERRFLTPMSLSSCPGLPPESRLSFGAFIGILDVVEYVRDGSQWKWTFDNAQPIDPILFEGNPRGSQIPDEVLRRVHTACGHSRPPLPHLQTE